MGATASILNKDQLATLTAEELGTKICELGDDYVVYKDAFITHNLDGAKVSAMSKEEQTQALKNIGVENESHQDILLTAFEQLKIAEPLTEIIAQLEEAKEGESASAENSVEQIDPNTELLSCDDLKVEGTSVKRLAEEEIIANAESIKRQSIDVAADILTTAEVQDTVATTGTSTETEILASA